MVAADSARIVGRGHSPIVVAKILTTRALADAAPLGAASAFLVAPSHRATRHHHPTWGTWPNDAV